MTGVLLGLLITVVVLFGLAGGVVVGFVGAWRAERRRLDILTERLMADSRVEAQTRATLAAMREAVRRHGGAGA